MLRRVCFCICLVACAVAANSATAVAQSRDPVSASGKPLQEVTVTATRELDHKALTRAVSGFVASHSAPGARIGQIGRWQESVCPEVTGLRPAFAEFVTRDVIDVARGVGAPTELAGKKCHVNVEIVFTSEPQALLDHIAKSYRVLLGYYPKSQMAQAMEIGRPIQAWYETGTRSPPDVQPPVIGLNKVAPPGGSFSEVPPMAADLPFLQSGVQVDSEQTAVGIQGGGHAGSLLGEGMRSEFLHVLIIAESAEVSRYTLQSVADYVAMLSLTRMAQLENCAPLPSITDLLANGCTPPVANALTAADRAYLKALYAADLEKNLNIERNDVHERMMRQIEGK